MKEPVRLSDPDGPAPEGLRQLLQTASVNAVRPMDASERALFDRKLSELEGKARPGQQYPAAARRVVRGAFGAAAVALGVVVALQGPAFFTRSAESPEPVPSAPVATPSPRAGTPTGSVSSAIPVNDLPAAATFDPIANTAPANTAPASPRRALPVAPRPEVSGSASSGTSDSLAEELALLDAARAERDPDLTLAALAKHEARFPTGRLAVEREYVAVQTLRKSGREPDARVRARALIERAPSSAYAAELQAWLGETQ
ncbi:MAG: hypothetical protein J0I07_31675 [Myxococcales bacterium]|nr:hypothetical protein [Myxococcales bacterium]